MVLLIIITRFFQSLILLHFQRPSEMFSGLLLIPRQLHCSSFLSHQWKVEHQQKLNFAHHQKIPFLAFRSLTLWIITLLLTFSSTIHTFPPSSPFSSFVRLSHPLRVLPFACVFILRRWANNMRSGSLSGSFTKTRSSFFSSLFPYTSLKPAYYNNRHIAWANPPPFWMPQKKPLPLTSTEAVPAAWEFEKKIMQGFQRRRMLRSFLHSFFWTVPTSSAPSRTMSFFAIRKDVPKERSDNKPCHSNTFDDYIILPRNIIHSQGRYILFKISKRRWYRKF